MFDAEDDAENERAGERGRGTGDGDRVLGLRDELSPGRDSRGRVALMVVPPVELVAFWELIDAQYGDPVPVAVFGEPVVDVLDDFALVELIVQLERDASLARARQLAVVEVLSRRASMNPFWPVRVGEPNITAEEVAAALGSSRAAGRHLVDTARLFAGPLLATAGALAAGDIDWGKAKIFAAVLGEVAIQVAVDVQARVLPGAGRRTHAQLRRDLARALIVVDPDDAEQRVVRASDKRRVCRPKVLPDGMAGIWAVLPGVVAGQIDTALTTAARTARAAGDPRTADQLRADTLAAALTGADPFGTQAAGTFGVGSSGAGTSTVGSSRTATSGVTSFGVTSFAAGSPNAGSPNAGSSKAGSSKAGSSRGGSARVGSCGARCTGVRVDVTVSLATLLGVDESPGELAGYGPITAQSARRLAATGTWRRLITDPATGTVLDVGKTRYRPPADLAQIVRARDTRCLSPICEMPARRCDLDHRIPYAADGTGGSTSAENLAPLCERDHLIKTHARWHLHRATDGTVTWTTPTGHHYTYRSDPPPGAEPPLAWDTPPPF